MAGFGAALAAMGGMGEGRRDAYRDAMTAKANAAADANSKATLAENAREYDDTATRNQAVDARQQKLVDAQIAQANAAAGKTTSDTAATDALTKSVTTFRKTLEAGGLNAPPPDFAKKTDAEKISYFNRLGVAALAAGDTDTAREAGTFSNNIALSAQRESTANLNVHKMSLVDAQAAAERDLPARARVIAAGHDQASLQRATMEVQGRQELAQFNANTRAGLVQLAAAYRTQNMSVQDAVRTAIAQYNGDVQIYKGQTSPQAQILNPAGSAAATMPTIVMPSPSGTGLTFNITFDRNGNMVKQPGGNGVGGNNNGGASNNQTVNPQKVQSLKAALAKMKNAGLDPRDPKTRAMFVGSGGGYSDAEYDAALGAQQASGQSTPSGEGPRVLSPGGLRPLSPKKFVIGQPPPPLSIFGQ